MEPREAASEEPIEIRNACKKNRRFFGEILAELKVQVAHPGVASKTHRAGS